VSGDEGFTTLVRMPLNLTRKSDLLVRGTAGFSDDGLKPATVTLPRAARR
jgi:hypothetical protein